MSRIGAGRSHSRTVYVNPNVERLRVAPNNTDGSTLEAAQRPVVRHQFRGPHVFGHLIPLVHKSVPKLTVADFLILCNRYKSKLSGNVADVHPM
jgi:hypothetical protein